MKIARALLCLVVGILVAAPYVVVQTQKSELSYAAILFLTGFLLAGRLTRRML
jgi:hypothetical protein